MYNSSEMEGRQSPEAPRILKRKRSDSMLLTPPLSHSDPEGAKILSRAVNVLSTAATALSQVTILYESDHIARDGLLQAVDCLKKVNEGGGKLIICGVGKSGLVGQKMVATMKSLGLGSSFMHASEALHGDLGDIRAVSTSHIPILTHGLRLMYLRTMPLCSLHTLAKPPNS